VADDDNYRVLGFDMSNGVTDNMSASWVFGESDFTSAVNYTLDYPGLNGTYDVTYDPYNNNLWVQGHYNLYNWDLTSLIGGKSLSDTTVKSPNTGYGVFDGSISNEISLIILSALSVSAALTTAYRYKIRQIAR